MVVSVTHIKSHEISHKKKSPTSVSKKAISVLVFPLLIFAAWYLLSLVTSFINFSAYINFFGGLSAWLMMLIVYSIFGWNMVEDHNKNISETAKIAALLGLCVGLIGAITGFIMIKTNPAIVSYAMQQIAAYGVQMTNEQIAAQVQIGGYIGFISGPVINAGLGAGLAALGGFIAKKKWIKI